MSRTSSAPVPDLDDILAKHGIAPAFHEAFYRLARYGQINDPQFRVRLHYCRNYQECTDAIVARIAGEAPQPAYFESLDLPDILPFPTLEPSC